MSCLFDSLCSFTNIISFMKTNPILITPDLKLSSIVYNEE